MAEKEKKIQIRSALLLFLATIIWGTAYVAQSKGADTLGGFAFMGIRNLIGGTVLIPVIALSRKMNFDRRPSSGNAEAAVITGRDRSYPILTRTEAAGGVVCGICLAGAGSAQQIGIAYTTTARAGFLTSLYVIIVPILGIFMKKRVKPVIWVSVAAAVLGLYLLCMNGTSFSLGYGEAIETLGGVLYAFQIIAIGRYAPKCSTLPLSCVEYYTTAVICLILSLLFEHNSLAGVGAAMLPLLYAGVLSSAIAFTLQNMAQKNLNPTLASLIMCMESVISAVSGWALLGQTLSGREIMGCVLMFAAIVLATLKG